MLKTILISVGVSLVATVAIVTFFSGRVPLGASSGTEHYNQENFYGGATFGGVNNTAISARSCATATFNPGSLTTTTIGNATSTDIALTGAVAGDLCSASLTSATTSAIDVRCGITGTATATLSVLNTGVSNAAIDLATGTAKVCYTH